VLTTNEASARDLLQRGLARALVKLRRISPNVAATDDGIQMSTIGAFPDVSTVEQILDALIDAIRTVHPAGDGSVYR
jgi:hypothetical protein